MLFQVGRYRMPGLRRKVRDQFRVSLVGEGIVSWVVVVSCVEVKVGQREWRVRALVECAQQFVKAINGVVQTVKVELLGVGSRDLYGEVGGGADFGNQEDDDGKKVRFHAWSLVGVFPSAIVVGTGHALGEETVVFIVGRRRKLVTVKDKFSLGKNWDEGADRSAIALKRRMIRAKNRADIETVGVSESFFEKFAGHTETDGAQVSRRRKFEIGELLHVKGEFGSNVTVRTLAVGDGGAVLAFQPGERDGGGGIDGLRMPDRVAEIVRQGADRERIFVQRACVLQHPDDKISRANVVGEVAEESFAEGVVPHVLDGASAIGIRVCNDEFMIGGARKLGQEERPYRIVPCEIDQFLVGQNGVSMKVGGCERQCEQDGKTAKAESIRSRAHGIQSLYS